MRRQIMHFCVRRVWQNRDIRYSATTNTQRIPRGKSFPLWVWLVFRAWLRRDELESTSRTRRTPSRTRRTPTDAAADAGTPPLFTVRFRGAEGHRLPSFYIKFFDRQASHSLPRAQPAGPPADVDDDAGPPTEVESDEDGGITLVELDILGVPIAKPFTNSTIYGRPLQTKRMKVQTSARVLRISTAAPTSATKRRTCRLSRNNRL